MATVEDIAKVRRRIGDSAKSFVDRFEGDGSTTEYGLTYHNNFAVEVKVNGVVLAAENYTVVPSSGQILFNAAPAADAVVDVAYSYAGYTDAQLSALVDEYGADGAAIECLEELLADSARLYDYQQGQTVDKRSQVFDHLKELLASAKTAAGEDSSYGLVIGNRHPDEQVCRLPRRDLSRDDNFSDNNV